MARTRCAASPFGYGFEQCAEVAIDTSTCAGDDSGCPVGWNVRLPGGGQDDVGGGAHRLRRFGAHDDSRSIGARRWVSMLAGLEEHQAELAHLNFVAVG